MDVKEMAKMGGKASVKKRFQGKSKKEISEIMKKVRAGRTIPGQLFVDCLNRSVSKQNYLKQ